ncbi:swi5-dependent recombination DNA repair protein 1 homolog isoform X1 [Coregonus clupeaformis]|uniref:swi5-dependent recombination DNA repair protein 1 homolog isoform X1 n=2 Tax=Coregonus clupeaformis TaxID=59861 RepID=UPI001BDF7D9D|nr:swi5-dependent recombination DNA repair protein 1 homolog isoform X1 [Coregonus clupeaformis]
METTPKTTKSKSVYGTPCYLKSSPCESSNVSVRKPKQQMSSSLKERLKRSRRSFTSPVSVAKRLNIDEDDKLPSTADKKTEHGAKTDRQKNIDINRNDTTPSKCPETRRAGVPCPMPESAQPTPTDLLQLGDQLKREVKERTETLRRLKMVKMYRSKNDLAQLRVLIDKWRSCSQAALYELQSDLPIDGRKASISQLIDLFGLEDRILHFDRTEEDFTNA